MKRISGIALPIIALALSPLSGLAQQRQTPDFAVSQAAAAPVLSLEQDPNEDPESDMGQSGMFLGIVGMLGGAAIGSGVSQSYCEGPDKNCTSRYAFTGALISGSILVPVGVHIANKAPRRLGTSLAVSALTGTALYFAMRAIPGEPIQIAPFLAAPVQMVTSIRIETK